MSHIKGPSIFYCDGTGERPNCRTPCPLFARLTINGGYQNEGCGRPIPIVIGIPEEFIGVPIFRGCPCGKARGAYGHQSINYSQGGLPFSVYSMATERAPCRQSTQNRQSATFRTAPLRTHRLRFLAFETDVRMTLESIDNADHGVVVCDCV